jgi:hypothetical protein
MMAEKFTQPTIGQPTIGRAVFAAALARLVGQPRFDRLWGMPLVHRFATREAMRTPDPVLLAVLAIDRVGPAAVRACASGVEVCVTAPDEATAKILRAALAQTARRRGTDRLIRIVVEGSLNVTQCKSLQQQRPPDE